MCGGVHYGEVEGLVSVERWSCSRGASCVVEYTMGRLRDWSLWRGGLVCALNYHLTRSGMIEFTLEAERLQGCTDNASCYGEPE